MEHSTVSITDNNTQRFRYRKMEGALRLRQLDFCSQLLAICIGGYREESYRIIYNWMKS